MSDVREVRDRLIEKYGEECFIDKLKLRPDKVSYTGKGQRSKMGTLTYHHIEEKSKGGATTEENGALLSVSNHRWFNKQSEESKKKMNKMFQDYKLGLITVDTETGKVEGKTYEMELSDCIEIQTHDINKRKQRQREKQKLKNQIEKEYLDYLEAKRLEANKKLEEYSKELKLDEWKQAQKEIMDDVIDELRY